MQERETTGIDHMHAANGDITVNVLYVGGGGAGGHAECVVLS